MANEELINELKLVVRDLHPNETKILNEAKLMLLILKDEAAYLLDLNYINATWLPAAKLKVDENNN